MRTSIGAERGYTLTETLVAVAILAVATLTSASAMMARSSDRIVDRAADALVLDLKRLRLHAETTGDSVSLEGGPHGYAAKALDIDRRFPESLSIAWNGEREASLLMSAGVRNKGATVIIVKAEARAVVQIVPATGKIRRVE